MIFEEHKSKLVGLQHNLHYMMSKQHMILYFYLRNSLENIDLYKVVLMDQRMYFEILGTLKHIFW